MILLQVVYNSPQHEIGSLVRYYGAETPTPDVALQTAASWTKLSAIIDQQYDLKPRIYEALVKSTTSPSGTFDGPISAF